LTVVVAGVSYPCEPIVPGRASEIRALIGKSAGPIIF
jgi:hypothetical protein